MKIYHQLCKVVYFMIYALIDQLNYFLVLVILIIGIFVRWVFVIAVEVVEGVNITQDCIHYIIVIYLHVLIFIIYYLL
jgi:hypothetical protein